MLRRNFQAGSITPALLVITTVFTIIIYGLLFMLSIQVDLSQRQTASDRAYNIAEAGINYYRWHLAHSPSDFTDGTGIPGPYVHEFLDPQGSSIGSFSLEITPPQDGSSIVTIQSTGWVNEKPKVKRSIRVQYGIPSFSQYSFLTSASAWYGSGATVNGRIHSNNGIRMDGINTSLVTSAQATYLCGSETGCNPSQTRPGVWGSGGDRGLWQFPVTTIDFNSVSLDFASMRDAAQENGIYLTNSGQRGYHLQFMANGTVRINRVTGTSSVWGYSVPGQGFGDAGIGGCERLYQIISNESYIGSYELDDAPIIFIEDNIWVEGIVNGRTTVASVRFPILSSNSVIWIPNSITYSSYDGSSVLGLVAQSDIYLGRNLPNYFNLDAVLMSQRGKIIRHGYLSGCGSSTHSVKQRLTLNGGLISYFKSYWNFGSGPTSGFRERIINYDTNLLYSPPPYFPTNGEYEFISWEEVAN